MKRGSVEGGAIARLGTLVALTALAIASTACAPAKLILAGDSRELRKGAERSAPSSPDRPPILLLALDGVDRALIYEMLRHGELPGLARLLSSDGAKFPHTYFDDSLLTTLPSSTMAAWVTTLTGVAPAYHGVAGNEFFIRETGKFAAPGPVTFSDSAAVISIYTNEYLNKLCLVPSVYDRMRATDPNVLVWVAMHQYFAGADRLLLTKTKVIADAFPAIVDQTLTKLATAKQSRTVYEQLDKEVMDVVIASLENGPLPDVLTVYLSGTDLYGHIADEGPDVARRVYLREVLDPQFSRLGERLVARDALANRFVVLTSDHGHTEILRDDAHALAMKPNEDPPAVLTRAGFRLRPFALDVSPKDDFQSVLAYQGAMAYVYVADRSACPNVGNVCDWSRPPRYEEDVLAVAEAFYKNNDDGSSVPVMKDKIDLILTRRPRPYAEQDLPFEVYVGGGRVVPVDEYLKDHPHPTYVAFNVRLHDLAVGPHGERAGDVLLIAHNGDREAVEDRYYFASPYRSWHGSPSRKDSEIPLIVAHAKKSTEALRDLVKRAIGPEPRQQKVTDLLLELRGGSAQL